MPDDNRVEDTQEEAPAPEDGGLPDELAAALQPSEEDYSAFDQGTTGPQSIGPPPLSTAPDEEGVAGTDGQSPEEGVLAFDPKVREDFLGLLYLGKLSKTFVWGGHRFVIRTLKIEETLEIGALQQPYIGTMTELKAYQAAVAAGCLVSIDNKPLPVPLTMDPEDSVMRNRFDYIISSWYPVVLDVIYTQYLTLEQKVNEVLVAMGKVRG